MILETALWCLCGIYGWWLFQKINNKITVLSLVLLPFSICLGLILLTGVGVGYLAESDVWNKVLWRIK